MQGLWRAKGIHSIGLFEYQRENAHLYGSFLMRNLGWCPLSLSIFHSFKGVFCSTDKMCTRRESTRASLTDWTEDRSQAYSGGNTHSAICLCKQKPRAQVLRTAPGAEPVLHLLGRIGPEQFKNLLSYFDDLFSPFVHHEKQK